MKSFYDRVSSEERDVDIRLLPGQNASMQEDDSSIDDLLERAALNDAPVRATIGVGDKSFILYATKVQETANFTLTDAAHRLKDFMALNPSSSISVFYTLAKEDGLQDVTCLATLSHSQSAFADSLAWSKVSVFNTGLPFQTKRTESGKASSWFAMPSIWKAARSRRGAFWSVLGLISLAVILIYRSNLDMPFQQHFENGIWIRYDLKESEGPRYQLQFSRHNVSDWKNPYPDGKWAVRIDDQAIIPASLMDEDELRYQTWFRERYPAMRDVVDSKEYLSQEFLSDPDRLKVPADWLFHPAHCMLALRRYWKAKESGHHVCPRDIDHKHIHHCLDSLDEWFFIGGEMRKPPPKPIDYEAEWALVWKTKVCW